MAYLSIRDQLFIFFRFEDTIGGLLGRSPDRSLLQPERLGSIFWNRRHIWRLLRGLKAKGLTCHLPGDVLPLLEWRLRLLTRSHMLLLKHPYIGGLIVAGVQVTAGVFQKLFLQLTVLLKKNQVLLKVLGVEFLDAFLFVYIFDSLVNLLIAHVDSIRILVVREAQEALVFGDSFKASFDTVIH